MPDFFATQGAFPVWGAPSYGQFFGSPVKNCINSRALFPDEEGIYSRSVTAFNPPFQFLHGISMPSLYGYHSGGIPNHPTMQTPCLSTTAMGFNPRSLYDRMIRPFSPTNIYPSKSHSGVSVTESGSPAIGQKDQRDGDAQVNQGHKVSGAISPDAGDFAAKPDENEKTDPGSIQGDRRYNHPVKADLPEQRLKVEKDSGGLSKGWKKEQQGIDQQAEHFDSYRRRNVLVVNEWFPVAENAEPERWLLQKPFKQLTGLKWKALPAHEQRRLVDNLRQHLCWQPVDLKKNRDFAVDRTAWYLSSRHQSGFQECSPDTAAVLRKHYGRDGIVFGDHVIEVVNQAIQEYTGQLTVLRVSKSMLNMEQLSGRTAALLGSSPLEAGFQECNQLAGSLLSELEDAEKQAEHSLSMLPEPLQALYKAMIADLECQKDKIKSFMARLDVNSDDNPLGHDKWQKVKANELKVAITVVDNKLQSLAAKKIPDQERIKSLSKLRGDLVKELDYVGKGIDGYDYEARSKGRLRTHDYVTSIRKLLFQKGVASSEDKIKSRQGKARAEVLKKGWQPISKQLAIEAGDKTGLYTSQIIPASSLSLYTGSPGKESTPGTCILQYKEGEGVPSLCNSETRHAVNLNETGLYKGEQEGEGNPLFRGLRSGTIGPGPIFVPDKAERQMAARQRATELVVAALRLELENHPEKWLDSLKGQTVPVRLVSTSLLSTDAIRNSALVKKLVKQGVDIGLKDNELEMQKEQVEVLEEIKRELEAGGTVTIRDAEGTVHSVKVGLETAIFNFGVNLLSLKELGEKEANYGSKDHDKRFIGFKEHAWHEAPKYNIKALKTLMGDFDRPGAWEPGGWVQSFMEKPDASDQDKKIVQQLARQIRELYLTGDYKQEGEDAYKMVARISLLAYKIGAVSHFNCKSGKDRTGEADATVKRLAAEVDALGYVPDPWEPVSRQDQLRSQLFAWNSGNMELLLQNANEPGYKVATGMNRIGPTVWGKVRHQGHPQFEKAKQRPAQLKGLFAPAA